ncbi:hypothetical protein E2C01_008649 [Portunus trituberculatus]|uniref:Uncharacterized protein n=1 Tax=Portunus trituberculatus TaxID=210409 RepID=A0A5B7D4Y9_PORTR|nr:hypothetical protein [Portunus trituberculatus]
MQENVILITEAAQVNIPGSLVYSHVCGHSTVSSARDGLPARTSGSNSSRQLVVVYSAADFMASAPPLLH